MLVPWVRAGAPVEDRKWIPPQMRESALSTTAWSKFLNVRVEPGGSERGSVAARRELRDLERPGGRIEPEEELARVLVDAPLLLVVPERVGELSRGQAIAEGDLQPGQVEAVAGYVLHRVLAVEHEEGQVEAEPDVRRELGQGAVAQEGAGIPLAAPEEEPGQLAAEALVVEQRLATAGERRLVAGALQRAGCGQLGGPVRGRLGDPLGPGRGLVRVGLGRHGARRSHGGEERDDGQGVAVQREDRHIETNSLLAIGFADAPTPDVGTTRVMSRAVPCPGRPQSPPGRPTGAPPQLGGRT